MHRLPVYCFNAQGNKIAILDFREGCVLGDAVVERSGFWGSPVLRGLPSLVPEAVVSVFDQLKSQSFVFDQLLQVHVAEDDCYPYHIHNADGSYAAQCGNGARSLIAYLSGDGGDWHTLLSPTNVQKGRCLSVGGVRVVEVSVGEVSFGVEDLLGVGIAVDGLRREEGYYLLPSPYEGVAVVFACAGNPHVIIALDQLCAGGAIAGAKGVIEAMGDYCNRARSLFRDGVNVSVYQMRDDGGVAVALYERGVGFTGSCGSALVSLYASLFGDGGVRAFYPFDFDTMQESKTEVLRGDAGFMIRGPVVDEGVFSVSI